MTAHSRETMNGWLLDAEWALDAFGWDVPPKLAAFSFVEAKISFQTLPIDFPDDPVSYLVYLGSQATTDPALAANMAKLLPELFAIAFCFEGWASDTPRAELPPGLGHADMPDAKEIRTIVCLDKYGRTYAVERCRGEEPAPVPSDEPVFGRVAECLRYILLALMKATPDEEEAVATLEKISLIRKPPE